MPLPRPRVTVSLPHYGCRPWIRRAVDSLLQQSWSELQVVVVNDGDEDPPWPELADIDDPRLVRFELGSNRGRYFADAVVLAATDDPYLLIQDADDWSEPDRVERLLQALRKNHANAAFSDIAIHDAQGRRQLRKHEGLDRPLHHRLRHISDHFGLFRTDALRAVGGQHPGFRLGFDTLLVNLMAMTGPVQRVPKALYHRRLRAGSLTTNRRTGLRSRMRERIRARLAADYRKLLAEHQRYLRGEIRRRDMCKRIRKVVFRDRNEALYAAVQEAAGRLKRQLKAPKSAQKNRGQGAAERFERRVGNRTAPVGADLVVTFLTGRRPDLARATIDSLLADRPGLFDGARFIALLNSHDPSTEAWLRGLPFLDALLLYRGEGVLPIGLGFSRLMREAMATDLPYVLHLEDDWRAGDGGRNWLEEARDLLDRRRSIGQVRLRHSRERVAVRHVVTGRPIRWELEGRHRLSASAHFTFNPSLLRSAALPFVVPCTSERHAMQRYLRTGLASAQLLPGIFRHLGGKNSLRETQQKKEK